MKLSQVAIFSLLGMAATFGGVYGLTPAGGLRAEREVASVPPETPREEDDQPGSTEPSDGASATFTAGTSIKVEGRLGHASLPAERPDETFLLLEVRGDDAAKGTAPRAALALVIDKSGSMTGSRIANAISAATGAVDRLRDGDQVTVVAFDTRPEVVVPLTTISASSRASVASAIRGIKLGGDTCISCGMEEALTELRRGGGATGGDLVPRMLVLSDGDTNNGIRDIPGFKALAQRAMGNGVSVSTIGVDLEYNEKIMSAIAQSANGRHYFVENDRDLARVFDAEAAALTETLASNVVAEIELEKGVELVRVFDRTFGRSGTRVNVPLGSLSRGEVKTVLLKVRLAAQAAGTVPVARVRVDYRDVAAEKDASTRGALATELTSSSTQASTLDGVVFDRVQRSETAAALREANTLFSLGKTEDARRRLTTHQQSLSEARGKAKSAAPASRTKDVDASFEAQEREVNNSIQNFATPPPAAGAAPSRPVQSQVKRNIEFSDHSTL
jgi:Ca-activated chloride channel family protein